MATYNSRKVRLGHQHGDNLSLLRNPPRAEAARPLLGQLEAHRAGMKKQVDLWYKEQNFIINKINRGQAKVYKTFLRAHYDQRRLARIAAEKKRQQELQEAAATLSSGYGSISDGSTPRVGALSLDAYQKLPGITKQGDPVTDLKRAAGEDENDGFWTAENVGKKYNRHRSEFSVVVNAPAAIPAIKAAVPDDVQYPTTATGENSAEIGGENKMVNQGKSERRAAKVLVVRKQTPDGGSGRKEASFITEHTGAAMASNDGGMVIQEGSRSFIQERSGSIYIQTIIMANAEIGEKAAENTQTKLEAAKSPIEPLQPSQTLIHDHTSASMVLPAISEVTQKKTKGDDSSVPKPKPSQNSPRRKKASNYKLGELKVRIVKKKPPPPTSYTVAILEREKQRESLIGGNSDGTSNRLTCSENEGNLVYSETDNMSVSTSKKTRHTTMAEYNRRQRKKRATDMRELLDRETPILYEKNEQGDIVQSGYDFKRKEFKRPSSREKKVRKKLLQQSRETQKDERERVIQYIDKLSEEERQERQERERRMRQKEQNEAAAQAEAKKLRAAETDPGQLLRSLIRAFRKGDPVGQSGDPNSVSSLENCSYIRVYNADQRGRSENKKSSWRQKSTVINPR